jgi:murein DD-endopeptidase MepM/ murein hydrolase activator NlpD
MRKNKYRFNPETLTYEKDNRNFYNKILRSFLPKFIIAAVLGILMFYAFTTTIFSPEDLFISEKNENLKLKYELLNKELDYTVNALENLQHRDDDIYRTIFQADPIPATRRKAGFGGVDRYGRFKNYQNSELLINTSQKTDILSKVMLVQSESYNEIFDLVKNTEKMASCIPAIQPIALNDLTRFGSAYGKRLHPILKIWKMHAGVDLTAPRGTKIYAAGDGVVFKAGGSSGGYGRIVKINHGFGYVTFYAHMQDIHVRAGQRVKRGDVIGTVGNTGLSTSPHLHYEVRINGQHVNPVNFYYEDLSDEEYQKMIEASSKAQTHIFE